MTVRLRWPRSSVAIDTKRRSVDVTIYLMHSLPLAGPSSASLTPTVERSDQVGRKDLTHAVQPFLPAMNRD